MESSEWGGLDAAANDGTGDEALILVLEMGCGVTTGI